MRGAHAQVEHFFLFGTRLFVFSVSFIMTTSDDPLLG